MIKTRETVLNIVFSFLFQVVTILCGLIVPRLIISTYGSDTNGTIATITQFLAYITLLETGIGGVAKASFYKPLADNDSEKLNSRVRSVSVFFRRISLIFIPYAILLSVVLPFVLRTDFSFEFIFSLVLVLALSIFSNYFFGLSSRLLLQADNKTYLVAVLDILCLVVNTILTFALIKTNSSIILVKLISSIIFFVKPIILYVFVKIKYKIRKPSIKPEKLKGRWDGFAQHFAFFIHNNTDIVLISLFLNVGLSSVYSVYSMVVTGLVTIIVAIVTSFNATFGFLYSKGEKEALSSKFNQVLNICTFLTISLFGICLFLITPFIEMYTKDVNDISYISPLFGVLFIVAELVYCLRTPFSSVALSAGKYKETRNGSIIEMLLNIILSLILIKPLGLIGIAIGTLVAMLYRTIDFAVYCKKNLVFYSFGDGINRLICNCLGTFIGLAICFGLRIEFNGSLLSWVINAIICSVIIFVSNLLFICLVDNHYSTMVFSFFHKIKGDKIRGRKK